MGFGGLLNQLATTTAGGGMGAVVENYPVASGYSVSAGDVVDVEGGEVLGSVNVSQQPLSSFAEGNIVQINENGSPVDFYIAKYNYESGLNGSGRTLLVRKDCYDRRALDSNNTNSWANSTLRSWLNSTYKNLFESEVQNAMSATTYYYTPGAGNWTVTTRSDAVFLLSATEMGESEAFWMNVEGATLPVVDIIKDARLNGTYISYWLRSPYKAGNTNMWYWFTTGGAQSTSADGSEGVRPAFTLPNTFNVIVKESTPRTQAIALQSGNAGDTIPVCYSGIVKADWATEGQQITSDGVYGAGIIDGVLQVWSKYRPELTST